MKSSVKGGVHEATPRCGLGMLYLHLSSFFPVPIGSMYGIFTYIYHGNQPNVGKYTIHGSYGVGCEPKTWCFFFLDVKDRPLKH